MKNCSNFVANSIKTIVVYYYVIGKYECRAYSNTNTLRSFDLHNLISSDMKNRKEVSSVKSVYKLITSYSKSENFFVTVFYYTYSDNLSSAYYSYF